ncbi:MAG TPA: adenylate/guanylate cyclase domain-containing protein [Candidatus Dormibacteraeota bacterium]|nr:adenylate/guanylate cyclase domain-containing protein [Candidatus Dormibacteraeota bacterium]
MRIAFVVMGESNPIDLVWAPSWASHLVLDWEWPSLVEWRQGLARFCRLILFDKRGTGLSDRQAGVATLEERSDDIRAVMDAAGSERAVLFGVSEGGSMACFFAATYPERTRALILWEVQARWVQSPDYPWGATPEAAEETIRTLAEQGPTDDYLFGSTPMARRRSDLAYYEFFKRYAQAAASPSAYADLERMNIEIDVRGIMPSIRVPTLVMNRVADRIANPEAARQLAASIDGARYLEFPGEIHGTFALDSPVLEAVEEFITGNRPEREPERALATVLFIDIVGATAKAVDLGDRRWAELLERHHRLVRAELARHHGREIDNAGDGFFATFDGPARAIRCANDIGAAVRDLGIEIRAGLHTGECEYVEGKVRGIAVHIGARVVEHGAAGEVLVSQTVRDLVAGSGIEFVDRGVTKLKGVPGRWRLWAVRR